MGFIVFFVITFLIFMAAWRGIPAKIELDNGSVTWPKRTLPWIAFIPLAVVLAWNSILIVPAGHTSVATFFGSVQKNSYRQGFHIVNPLLDFHRYSVRQWTLNLTSSGDPSEGEGSAQAMSKENLPITIDVTFPFVLNSQMAPWVYDHLGSEEAYFESLIKPAARNAVRDATPQFTADEATTTNREGLAITMREVFASHIKTNLMENGLDPNLAEQTFNILPVMLRKAMPPQAVLESISLKEAAKQDLQRQKTLTQIAEEVATRRENEGQGVANLFNKLPEGFEPSEIATVLYALAAKEQADAILKAVETGKVSTLVLGTTGSPVAIPPQGIAKTN